MYGLIDFEIYAAEFHGSEELPGVLDFYGGFHTGRESGIYFSLNSLALFVDVNKFRAYAYDHVDPIGIGHRDVLVALKHGLQTVDIQLDLARADLFCVCIEEVHGRVSRQNLRQTDCSGGCT